MTPLYDRAQRLMLLNRMPGKWNIQKRYPAPFYAQHRPMREEDVRAHLEGEHWIASRVPEDALTDRLVFDLDCKMPERVGIRNERYEKIRELMGRDREPLAWLTPSGFGLRLAYRIPRSRLSTLAPSQTTGPLPDALRAAGVRPAFGDVEIYPSQSQADRQLFGREMPFVDPDTLRPLTDQGLKAAVEHVEAWHDEVEEGLSSHIQQLPAQSEPEDMGPPAGPELALPTDHRVTMPRRLAHLVKNGLQKPSSRYAVEFVVGQAIWLWPVAFADLGVRRHPDRQDVAVGIATWLAERTNGLSREWESSRHRYGREGAIREWKERYLRRNRTDGLAPVDRMRRAAAAATRGHWPTVNLTADEREEVLRLARRAKWTKDSPISTGAELYRFEIWTSAWWRVFKKQLRRGGESGSEPARTAQIAAEWMQHWPYGRRYRRYLDQLLDQGVVEVRETYFRNPHPDLPGRARTYLGPEPDWIGRHELAMDPDDVAERLRGVPVGGRQVTVDEGLHALHVVDTCRDLQRLYGRKIAQRVRSYVNVLRPPSPLAGF